MEQSLQTVLLESGQRALAASHRTSIGPQVASLCAAYLRVFDDPQLNY